MRPNERLVWPWLAALTVGLLGVACWLGYLSAFVDERWEGFAFFAGLFALAGLVATGSAAGCYATYTKKPRGWRQMRRDAEREAYIKQLEKEAFGDA